jgi:hypothetical protein
MRWTLTWGTIFIWEGRQPRFKALAVVCINTDNDDADADLLLL